MKKLICAALIGMTLAISTVSFAEEGKQDGANSSYTESEQNCKDGVCEWRK
ncbi:MAG: hypothetical protein J6O04_08850 [Selenomonadaceae bacterium]|nr:hypothetical protein [Selenomonadaceae bacterium]